MSSAGGATNRGRLSLDPPIPGSHRHRMTHREDQLPSLRGVTLRMLGQLPLARS
jgi:hypothetical protein